MLASIDLLNTKVYGMVADRHRSGELVQCLEMVDARTYSKDLKMRIVQASHSAHISKERRQYRPSVPNRFDFIITPSQGSWPNII